MMWLC